MISAKGSKTVHLQRKKSGLGFSIKGGQEHGIGVVVSWIKQGGAAGMDFNKRGGAGRTNCLLFQLSL